MRCLWMVTLTALGACIDEPASNFDTGRETEVFVVDGTGDGAETAPACTRDSECPAGADLCEGTARCREGRCVLEDAVVCEAPEDPCTENVCAPATGRCVARALGADSPCDDNDACTQGDHCGGGADAGRCIGAETQCTAQNDCAEVGVCNPLSGVCDTPTKPDGSVCTDAPARDGVGEVPGTCAQGQCQRLPSLSVGGYHACAIMADDSVRCWGRNDSGQLGLGHTTNVGDGFSGIDVRDARAVAIGHVDQLGLGTLATCAVGGGFLRCWGQGEFGALGYGDLVARGGDASTLPAGLPTVVLGNDFVPAKVVVGLQSACAISTNERVKCWGSRVGSYPGTTQVGVPGAPSIAEMGVLELGAFPVDELVGSDLHTCARSGTAVRCWGHEPELGLSAQGYIGDNEPIVEGPLMTNGWQASAIAATGRHTCAIDTNGLVRCWGSNGDGQLASGAVSAVVGVTGPVSFGLGLLATQLALGASHSCALFSDGSVRCWGRNTEGQLGRGDKVERVASAAETVPVALGGPAAAIGAGTNFTCAVLRDGTIRCWGIGTYGGLGTDATEIVGDDPDDMPPAAIRFD